MELILKGKAKKIEKLRKGLRTKLKRDNITYKIIPDAIIPEKTKKTIKK